MSTKPNKVLANVMFAAIGRFKGSPSREEILEFIKGKNET